MNWYRIDMKYMNEVIDFFSALIFATWPSGKAQTKFATSYAAAPHQLWWAQGGEERGSSDHRIMKKTKELEGFKGWLVGWCKFI